MDSNSIIMAQELNENGKYNVSFTLGGNREYSVSEIYRLESNYPVDELSKAVRKAKEIIGFDFTRSVDENRELRYDELKKSLKFGLIYKPYVEKDEHGDSYYYFENTEDYIVFLFECIKVVLPDVKYSYRQLKDEWLWDFENSGEALLNEIY